MAAMALRMQCVTVDCRDAKRVGEFWSALLGVPLQSGGDSPDVEYWLEPNGGAGPDILFIETPDTKLHKNRLHLDLRPDDQAAEVARALELGAARVDIGQGEPTWVVMADVEGNEFCILRALREGEPGP